ncbi:lipoprotein-releasing system ATP-binding protein LolD [Candidatus Poribacteria bacterium]|nr:lipoprotein-releasing system ATP-binding protein LolD [Candidatus Poribacteria bacterium]
MTDSNLITTTDLVKTFTMGSHEFTALNKINLSFKTGEFSGLVGPSGSGKTTFLNILGSLDVPTQGKAVVFGHSISELSTKKMAELRNHHLGFIFQTYNLLAVYTVYENVELPLLLLKMPEAERKKAVLQSLEWVGLTDKIKSRPAQLSGGECQRVSIARAMVKKPKLVLADEPTANLDAHNSHNILETMEKLNQELKTTFIFSTHDEKVIQYLRRTIVLKDGQVVSDDNVAKN